MIWFYSGTPGSGKSYHVAKDIYIKLSRGENVIASFPVNTKKIKVGRKGLGKFIAVDLYTLKPQFFIDYAKQNHIKGKEGQTLVILDECQMIFNPREFSRKDRLDWITFFTMHRHLGYNFILISQFDRLVDRQIRSLFEYEIKHRKVNNFGIGMFIPRTSFACVTYWYGVKEKISVDFIIYRKKYGSIYDTFMLFDEPEEKKQPVCEHGGEGGPMLADSSVSCDLVQKKMKNTEKFLIFLKKIKLKILTALSN